MMVIMEMTLSKPTSLLILSHCSTDPKAPAELVVVNLMVAVEGDLQLPAIRSLSDLKLAMSKLGSVSANDVLAVEVFWTPQVRWVCRNGCMGAQC